VMRT